MARIQYTGHVTNASVKETTDCPPVSSIVETRRLCFFGHVARSDSSQDHHRAVRASLRQPRDWRKPRGRPRTTWLMGIDADVQSANVGIHSAWRKANDRVLWRRIIDTATLHYGHATAPKRRGELKLQTPTPTSDVTHWPQLFLTNK